jgi:hypothetical protein
MRLHELQPGEVVGRQALWATHQGLAVINRVSAFRPKGPTMAVIGRTRVLLLTTGAPLPADQETTLTLQLDACVVMCTHQFKVRDQAGGCLTIRDQGRELTDEEALALYRSDQLF